MSQKELHRIEVVKRLIEKRCNETQAAEQLNISTRQIRRLKSAYVNQGAKGLLSKKRDKPGNHQLPAELKELCISLISQNYADFRPTLATEKLAECHNLHVSRETVRQWMIEANLWEPRDKRLKRAYQPRYRRECYGELIQIDGSQHHWFEGRAPKCTLLVYIDDATSQLMNLYFTQVESTFTYFEATKQYLCEHGKPVAFYSDKHSTFRTNKKGELGGDGITQFGRALNELNIDIICANSCQAKGRVERANQTLQDRLVKELRLRGITTIEEANAFVPEFISGYNRRFAKPPKSDHNAHRPLRTDDDLREIFCWQEERTLSHNLTVQYDRVLYLIEDSVETRKLARKRVTVFDYADGTIKIKYNGKVLPYSAFDKLREVDQGQIADNKRLGNVLQFVSEKQHQREQTRSASCPSRKHLGQPGVSDLRKATSVRRQRKAH